MRSSKQLVKSLATNLADRRALLRSRLMPSVTFFRRGANKYAMLFSHVRTFARKKRKHNPFFATCIVRTFGLG